MAEELNTSWLVITWTEIYCHHIVVDRIVPESQDLPNVDMNCDVDADRFVPSVEEH